MCEVVTAIVASLAAGAGATAAGATAGAATIGTTLQTIGTLIGIGGTVAQGVSTYRASKASIAEIEVQKKTEAQLNSQREQRSRKQFRTALAQQRAELIGRGVSLDSPTAVFLGQNAAREMTFEGQTIRQGAQATQGELSNSQRALRARGRSALFKGGFSAAGKLLRSAPTLWPELLT